MNSQATELIDKIQSAFSGVELEDGVSLNMTEYNDSSGCRPEFMERAIHDERHNWSSIPDEVLEQFLATFSFTDLKGYRFYMPAYMIWAIRNYDRSHSPIGEFTIFAIHPSRHQFDAVPFVEWFTDSQINVMKEFLVYMDDDFAQENLRLIEAQQAAPSNR
jgi:hypothetical protein